MPMSITMAISLVIFGGVQRQLQNRQARDTSGASLTLLWKKRLRASLSLVTLFGLTWTSGLLLLVDSHVAFQWIFVVLVATQGIFIFYFHVFTQRLLRKQVKAAKLALRQQTSGFSSTFGNCHSPADDSPASSKVHLSPIFALISGVFFGEQSVSGYAASSVKVPGSPLWEVENGVKQNDDLSAADVEVGMKEQPISRLSSGGSLQRDLDDKASQFEELTRTASPAMHLPPLPKRTNSQSSSNKSLSLPKQTKSQPYPTQSLSLPKKTNFIPHVTVNSITQWVFGYHGD